MSRRNPFLYVYHADHSFSLSSRHSRKRNNVLQSKDSRRSFFLCIRVSFSCCDSHIFISITLITQHDVISHRISSDEKRILCVLKFHLDPSVLIDSLLLLLWYLNFINHFINWYIKLLSFASIESDDFSCWRMTGSDRLKKSKRSVRHTWLQQDSIQGIR